MEWSKPLRDVLCVAMAHESRLGRGEHRPVRLLDVADVRAARITLHSRAKFDNGHTWSRERGGRGRGRRARAAGADGVQFAWVHGTGDCSC